MRALPQQIGASVHPPGEIVDDRVKWKALAKKKNREDDKQRSKEGAVLAGIAEANILVGGVI